MLSCIPPLGLPLYDPVRGELQDSMGYWQLLIRTMLTQNLGTVMGGWRLLQPGSVSATALQLWEDIVSVTSLRLLSVTASARECQYPSHVNMRITVSPTTGTASAASPQ